MSTTTNKITRPLITHEDAVIHFIQQLDIDMMNTLLDEGRTYQDMEKHVFVRKLGYAFDEFIDSGETSLNCTSGQCDAVKCNFKCRGYSFTVNNSDKHMDLIIEKDHEGKVLDIYECRFFLCNGMEKRNSYETRVRIDRE
jgi:hypothetical protein